MKVTRPNSNFLREALQPVPETAIFKMDGHYLWDPSLICTDWEAKVTGVRKSVVYYTSKNGVDYELYSRIPVWSQNDPVPLVNGQSLKISGVERPQLFLDGNGAVIALLASVYSANKDTDPASNTLGGLPAQSVPGPGQNYARKRMVTHLNRRSQRKYHRPK